MAPEAGEPPLSVVGEAARAGDPDRFLAAICAPAAQREALFALIAFNLELAKIPVTVSEPMLGEIRLAWWREALDDLFDRGAARGHEVMAALAAAHASQPYDRAGLTRLVDGRLFALSDEPAGPEALDDYIADTGGAYAATAVRALGGDDKAAGVAADVGWAEGAGRLIAALPAMIAEGRAPFAGVGDAPDALTASVQDLAKRGLARLNAARARRGDVPRACRAPLLSAHIAERTLKAATQDGSLTTSGEVSPFRARAALIWRAAAGRF